MGTFVAILLGTMAGGILIGLPLGPTLAAVVIVAVAAAGYFTSRGIPQAPAAAPELRINPNPFSETWRIFEFTRRNRTVFLSILGISWFWFYGALILAQLPNYAKEILGGNEQVVTVLLTIFSLGIGIGSLLCERLSGHKVEIGLVPFGSIGMTIFGLDLFFSAPAIATGPLLGALAFLQAPGSWRVLLDLGLLGLFGGFYIVPLYALVQQRSEQSHLSRIIAGNNILNSLFMVLSAGVAIALLGAGLSIPQVFLIAAALNAVVAVYIYTLVPEFLMRFIVWLLIHTLYRVEKEGLDQIPEEGAAVLVCNHVSFVDALIIGGCCRRPVRFVMDHNIFKIPILRFVFRTARAIPIASARVNPGLLEQAFDDIDAALRAGDVVCVFPEGRITKNGELNTFRPGIERILERYPAPVIPMALKGLWGSSFSRKYKGPSRLWPRRLWSHIGLSVGPPIAPQHASAPALQQAVYALRGERR
jgi:1-acyl-sn-glycerol-3-phosphate acyltransferase